MKKVAVFSGMVILLAACSFGAELESYDPAPDQMRINVGFRSAEMENAVAGIVEGYGGVLLSRNVPINVRTYLIPRKEFGRITSDGELLQMTKYIVEDQKCFAAFTPNDPSWSLQWGPPCIRSQEAWDVQRGNHNVILAVLDTGVDLDHPDLDGNVDTSIDWDFVNNDNNADDDYGHGTHVAGIAAAEINNGIGIAGMAQAKIMAVKVLNRYGSGYWSWIASGITYAADNGADVINMSIQGTSYDPSVEDAADYAYYTKDVVVIAAAGNYGSSQNCYPAAIGSVMGVAALQTCTSRASFSNWGLNNVDIAAPGVNIYSTYYQNRYDYMDGTSMASPHVAGVACLYRCQRPSGSAQKIWGALLRYAEDLGDPGVDPYYGHGRVKANGPYSPPVD